MEDNLIIDLYWERSEQAITETSLKYGNYLKTIAGRILTNFEDTEECVSDTYLQAWNVIPPNRPNIFSAFLGKITRNLALDRYRRKTADKRGGGEIPLVLEELRDCASEMSVERSMEEKELSGRLSEFIRSLPREEGDIFVCRYWYMDPVKEIAERFSVSESRVKNSLFRSRKKLRAFLQKEGFVLE